MPDCQLFFSQKIKNSPETVGGINFIRHFQSLNAFCFQEAGLKGKIRLLGNLYC